MGNTICNMFKDSHFGEEALKRISHKREPGVSPHYSGVGQR
ncbi:hypothetical protein FOVG_09520 [Fusarium oxysporum f. sp. pisi HDV247]|uniref:Uncharacterized protein n=1 Tax=Fusarium oxysporum f. sp. pisi HDV247 TaxID=1080344 RepID=W9P6Z8_FUSOX|nr:hypothetical protein FOVG_09520 [Fusarium oxysporum f. sp. pisi HDV247]